MVSHIKHMVISAESFSDVLALCLFMQGCRDLLISLLDNIDGLPLELPLTCRKALATVQQVCSVFVCCVCVCMCMWTCE